MKTKIRNIEKLQKFIGKKARIKKDEDIIIQKVKAYYGPVIRSARKILVRI